MVYVVMHVQVCMHMCLPVYMFVHMCMHMETSPTLYPFHYLGHSLSMNQELIDLAKLIGP